MDNTISKDILNEYYSALWSITDNFNSPSMLEFKKRHNEEYKTISAMHRKRSQLKKDLETMFTYTHRLAWFTLTYDNVKDKNTETTKRKEAFSFLRTIFKMFVVAEEYGEDNGRYHIHGFGAFIHGKKIEDFYKWHSREDIKLLTDKDTLKKIRYLTNYATKNVPRLRRNRVLNEYRKRTAKLLDPVFREHFPSLYKQQIAKEAFLIDLDYTEQLE